MRPVLFVKLELREMRVNMTCQFFLCLGLPVQWEAMVITHKWAAIPNTVVFILQAVFTPK